MKIKIPWPPTVNKYWRSYRGRVIVSAEGKAYRKAIGQLAMAHRFPKFGDSRLKVFVEAYVPDKRRRDLDNVFKASLDALQSAGVFADDGQIDDLHIVRKQQTVSGALIVHIEEMS